LTWRISLGTPITTQYQYATSETENGPSKPKQVGELNWTLAATHPPTDWIASLKNTLEKNTLSSLMASFAFRWKRYVKFFWGERGGAEASADGPWRALAGRGDIEKNKRSINHDK
jgi:hypothetical protein